MNTQKTENRIQEIVTEWHALEKIPITDHAPEADPFDALLVELAQLGAFPTAIELLSRHPGSHPEPLYGYILILLEAGEVEAARKVAERIPPGDVDEQLRAREQIALETTQPSDIAVLRMLVHGDARGDETIMNAHVAIWALTRDPHDLHIAREYAVSPPVLSKMHVHGLLAVAKATGDADDFVKLATTLGLKKSTLTEDQTEGIAVICAYALTIHEDMSATERATILGKMRVANPSFGNRVHSLLREEYFV